MKLYYLFIFLFPFLNCQAQSATYGRTINPEFEKKVNSYLNYTVPAITVEDLVDIKKDVIILDAREREEFEVSHIPAAIYIGYKDKDFSILNDIPKDKKIVVYCSIGYRSEIVAEKIAAMGYPNVYNLFGSIFEWVNQDHDVVDLQNKKTSKIHTYNKGWSKWVIDGKAEKVW